MMAQAPPFFLDRPSCNHPVVHQPKQTPAIPRPSGHRSPLNVQARMKPAALFLLFLGDSCAPHFRQSRQNVRGTAKTVDVTFALYHHRFVITYFPTVWRLRRQA